MTDFQQFIVTLVTGAVALCLQFLMGQEAMAFWLIAIWGIIMALILAKDMIETLKDGYYGVDILAITAILATLAVGEHWASLMILVMMTGGESLEAYATQQASRELEALLEHSPQFAHRINADGSVDSVPVDEIQVGDQVRVRPNELVPVDGVIVQGETFVDESSLTGESKPVEKGVGDELMSGSINGEASLTFEVKKAAKDSQYQRLVALVENSKEEPAPFVRLADRYAVPFTIIAYAIAFIAWFVSKDPVRFAEVLVVASPCPLIIAAPVAIVGGMSNSSRNGIVMKSGTSLEKLDQVKTAAFDKTGTITQGSLAVDDIEVQAGFEADHILHYAASAEQSSTHVLARSLVDAAHDKGLDLSPVNHLEEVTAAGVQGQVDSKEVKVGKADFVGAEKITDGKTNVYVAIDGAYAGRITFNDQIRPEAPATVQELESLDLKRIIMLTGDDENIAQRIAHSAGIEEVHANLLPEDKINLLKDLREESRPVMMVGDGVNDAPALTVADIGIAMGAHGSTAASESADAVILKDDLSKVAQAVKIAKHTLKVAKQAVVFGIVTSIILMLIASTGVIPALLGAILQEVMDLMAIFYALRARMQVK
ncbi:heavy metal translocating P-type ATPase [Aerococcus tenax]|uniref:heavy metal translocating P-type ATPase n=1 Tax=Aerococcus tenax TaxID=3078812 RepID=UPI0018A79E8E|nr:heavy metal translocating P-type ATPase [Aerococcus tenax]